MQYGGDKTGSKLLLLFVFFVFLYLAFFGFNIQKAYNYTIGQDQSFLQVFGIK